MVVYSMFDGSGIMALPWAEAGHTVYCFNADDADHGEYSIRMEHPKIKYINLWIDGDFAFNCFLMKLPKPDIIFAFPPCTMLSQSGSQHDREDGDIESAIECARMVERLGDMFDCPWMVENPVGKLSTLWRKPNVYFHPCEFGGYLRACEGSFHPKMPAQDGYNKKTGLWFGNGFVMPEKSPVESIGFFWGWKYLGGDSPRTKMLRSLTPRGFARAVMRSNRIALFAKRHKTRSSII